MQQQQVGKPQGQQGSPAEQAKRAALEWLPAVGLWCAMAVGVTCVVSLCLAIWSNGYLVLDVFLGALHWVITAVLVGVGLVALHDFRTGPEWILQISNHARALQKVFLLRARHDDETTDDGSKEDGQ